MGEPGEPSAESLRRGLFVGLWMLALDVSAEAFRPPDVDTGAERGRGGQMVIRSEAQARRSIVGPEAPGARLDFSFNAGETRVWLYRDGEWQVRGDLWHRSWRCVQYDIAIRFGVGTEGCTDVRWLGTPVSILAERQCHQTKTPYASGERQPLLAPEFDNITCAERVVRRQDD
jgi:hypothetical protein